MIYWIDDITPLRRAYHQWIRGRHSQIPRCCVAWFVLVRAHLPHRWLIWQSELRGRLGMDKPPEQSYARCIVCFVRNRWGSQHICTPDCVGVRGGTFRD